MNSIMIDVDFYSKEHLQIPQTIKLEKDAMLHETNITKI